MRLNHMDIRSSESVQFVSVEASLPKETSSLACLGELPPRLHGGNVSKLKAQRAQHLHHIQIYELWQMQPLVGIVMGSSSDAAVMDAAKPILEEFGVPYEYTIVSAHRTPDRLWAYGKAAVARGLKVLIAAAGGAAHLPGMLASLTPLPVIGVPIRSSQSLSGLDSLLSIVQMPKGIPVATVAIDNAANAALLAIRILSLHEPGLLMRMQAYQERLHTEALRPLEEEPQRFDRITL